MNTNELLEQLSNKSEIEIQAGLLKLMTENKLAFCDLNSAYIYYLNKVKEQDDAKRQELICCLMDMIFFPYRKKKLTTLENKLVQRTLYLLNQSRRFKMDDINAKLNYIGDDEARII